MIEAMACGTPVIAYRSGSVPEVITDGVSGFIVDDLDAAVEAVQRLGELDRQAVRPASMTGSPSSAWRATTRPCSSSSSQPDLRRHGGRAGDGRQANV